jgi:hypothetical protein
MDGGSAHADDTLKHPEDARCGDCLRALLDAGLWERDLKHAHIGG